MIPHRCKPKLDLRPCSGFEQTIAHFFEVSSFAAAFAFAFALADFFFLRPESNPFAAASQGMVQLGVGKLKLKTYIKHIKVCKLFMFYLMQNNALFFAQKPWLSQTTGTAPCIDSWTWCTFHHCWNQQPISWKWIRTSSPFLLNGRITHPQACPRKKAL